MTNNNNSFATTQPPIPINNQVHLFHRLAPYHLPWLPPNTNLSIHRTSQQSQLPRTAPTHNTFDTTTNMNKQPLVHNAKTAPSHTPQAPPTTTTPTRRSSMISHTHSPHTTHIPSNVIQPQHPNRRQTFTNNQLRTPPPPPNNTDHIWDDTNIPYPTRQLPNISPTQSTPPIPITTLIHISRASPTYATPPYNNVKLCITD